MKALQLTKQTGLAALSYGDAPTPQPKPGEALIRVKAAALNYLDIGVMEGKWQVELPHIGGSDVAGIVEQVNGASMFQLGQSVVVNPSIPCGVCDLCKHGQACETVNILGYSTAGGFAEYVSVPIAQLYAKPDRLSFTEAAAFPLTFLTAWHMLVTRANLQRGETVFIWGASGGLGSAAVQVAHQLGARVIAAVGSTDKAAAVTRLGADQVICYTDSDMLDQIKAANGGKLVDLVFESVGAQTWPKTLAMLRPCGRVVIAGTTSGDVVEQDLSDLYYQQLTIIGSRMGTADDFAQALTYIDDGTFKPAIDAAYPMQDFAAAFARFKDGRQMGKVVLELP